MSVIGLVNLAERLLNQGSAKGQDLPNTQKTANTPAANHATGGTEDLFTPSSKNGPGENTEQEAGLFSVTQFSFFSAAADFLLAQNTNPPNATPPAPAAAANNAAAQNTPGTAAAGLATLQAGTAGLLTNVGGGNAANAAPAAPTALTTNGAGANTANNAAAPTGALASQQQLQSLNTALAALGLTPQEIQQLDQVATILKDFDPSAYTALAYQLEQLAQAQQPPATATANPQNTATTATGNGTPAANNAGANPTGGNGTAFQIQELVIKFAGVQVEGGTTANGGGAAQGGAAAGGTGNGTFQATAFNLQVEEVNLTLTNGNGQTAQVQVPQANAPALKALAAGA